MDRSTCSAKTRQCYNKLSAHFQSPFPDVVSKQDSTLFTQFGEVGIRRYHIDSPRQNLIMYIHGGGFMLGNLDTHDSICSDIVAHTGYDLVAVDYLLSPEYRYPVQLHNVIDVFNNVDRGRTILAGIQPVVRSLCCFFSPRTRQKINLLARY